MAMMNELYVPHFFHLKEGQVKCAFRSLACRMNYRIIMSLMPYGLFWRRHRRLFQEYFHRNAVTEYQPIQRQEVQAFLRRLLATPDDFFHHIRQ